MNGKRGKKSKSPALLKKLLFLGPHTCPWWFGYAFDNPLRRFIHRPESILGEFASPGDTAVDIGCGIGYFSIALAELVGPTGRVVAFDVQAQMVERARQRAERKNLRNRIDFRVCAPDHIGFEGEADFVLAFWMLHEVSDPEQFLIEVRSFLRPSGHLMIAEPRLHVSKTRFSAIIELARRNGFQVVKGPEVRFSRCILCSPA
jgi:ubiquinone/menaquinone biosynthesis C-methylase UbiE